MTVDGFDFDEAFSRNIGWVSQEEMQKLRHKKIAIAGMGGVGGIHLITLVRMGFCKFNLADYDHYELANFNRQYGANLTTVGRAKLEVMVEEAKKINPKIEIGVYPRGVSSDDLGSFLDGVDLYVDGLDAFVLDFRIDIFASCWQRNIPAITYGPLGFSASGINFVPGRGLSFAQYFGLKRGEDLENSFKFFIGLSPGVLHAKAMVDRSRTDFSKKRGPSTPVGCALAAGIVATEAVKILSHRGCVIHSPCSYQFDAFTYRLKKSYMPMGFRNPLFKLRVALLKYMLKTKI